MSQVTSNSVDAALKQLESWTKDELKVTGVPGIAIAVVYQNKTVFAKGFGVREAGKQEPVDADTVFHLASVSKPVGLTRSTASRPTIGWASSSAYSAP